MVSSKKDLKMQCIPMIMQGGTLFSIRLWVKIRSDQIISTFFKCEDKLLQTPSAIKGKSPGREEERRLE